MKHVWKETGQTLSYFTDPPTVRERCETCGSLCWHYHGVNSFRFRRARDETRQVTPEDLRTPNAPVLDDELCAGRLLSPEDAVRIPNPQQPLSPQAFGQDSDSIVALPRRVETTWGEATPRDIKTALGDTNMSDP